MRYAFTVIASFVALCIVLPAAWDAPAEAHHRPGHRKTPTPTTAPSVVTPTSTVRATPTSTPEPTVGAAATTLQSLIDSTPSGGTLDLGSQLYRESATVSKPITIRGGEIRGSNVWTEWSQQGDGRWLSSKSVPTLEVPGAGVCWEPRCQWPEQVFRDGTPLIQVPSGSSPDIGQFSVRSDRRVLVRDDPRGRTMEVTVRTRWLELRSGTVTVDGLRARHAGNGYQKGALNARFTSVAPGIVVRNATLLHGHGPVLSFENTSGGLIEDSELASSGNAGFAGGFNNGIRFLRNRVHDNNTERFNPFNEAGGIKLSLSDDALFQGNEVYNNYGIGIWTDIVCHRPVYDGNRIHGNAHYGLYFENGVDGKARGNRVWENGWQGIGGGGISSVASSGTEVYENTLAWNSYGIVVTEREPTGDDQPTINTKIHHNLIAQEAGRGWAAAWESRRSEAHYEDPDSGNQGWAGAYYYLGVPEDNRARFRWTVELCCLGDFDNTPAEEGGRYVAQAEGDGWLTADGVPTRPAAR